MKNIFLIITIFVLATAVVAQKNFTTTTKDALRKAASNTEVAASGINEGAVKFKMKRKIRLQA